MSRLGAPLQLSESIALRNRFVATAHGSGAVADGIPVRGDAEYWARVAEGGAAMVIGGGAVVAPEATNRRGNVIALWRPEVVAPLRRRAEAIRAAGAVSIVQLLHLGRETLGADAYYSPVAPAAVRSAREATTPRSLGAEEFEALVGRFRAAAANALDAGIDGFELHAAHGYLLGQFLSPVANPTAESVDERAALLWRVVDAVRALDADCPIGIRLSVGDPQDAGLDLPQLAELLARLHPDIGYVNLTVGMRTWYVRDMATERPPLLDDVAALRAATPLPLLLSQGFRRAADMEAALAAGADLVGLARGLIADPELPRKVLAGRERTVRPCVACNEDCRLFEPVLLCTVNPALGEPGEPARRAAPLVRGTMPDHVRRVAVIGSGPAGLEAARALSRDADVVVFERGERLGGALAVAASAPHRGEWARLLGFYTRALEDAGVELRLTTTADAASLAGYDAAVVATGSTELPALAGALTVTAALDGGAAGLAGIEHLVVADDGFGWWPGVNALELGIAAGVPRITFVTPGTAFASSIPAESRAQLLPRLRRAGVTIRPATALAAVLSGAVELRDILGDGPEHVAADAVIAVGERRARPLVLPGRPHVVVGDAIVPRRVAHAIAEGRAAAHLLLSARDRTLAGTA